MDNNHNKYAYVTALTTEEYIPGCMALARSLVDVKSEYKLIVIIPESEKDNLETKLDEYVFLSRRRTRHFSCATRY